MGVVDTGYRSSHYTLVLLKPSCTSPYKPVSHIATEGPFRYTRNPAYLSMTMMYTGIAALANALWAIIVLPVALLVIQRGVIEREERYLERKFGGEYLSYKARVRRWI